MYKIFKNYSKRVRKRRNKQVQSNTTNSDLQVQAQKEQSVLKVSTLSALILAIFGISFGVAIKSLAVIFDGFIAFVSVGLGLLSLVTSRYIYKEDDDVFQYGYVRFEPMVNLFKSSVLVVLCLYAFVSAINNIIRGGYEIELGFGVVYAAFAFIFCLVLFIYTRAFVRDSDLIKVDNTEWKIDCVLYCSTIFAFGIVYAVVVLEFGGSIEQLDKTLFAHYIDPILLAILSAFLCISPLRICIENLKDLLMVAPKEIDEKITIIMENLSEEFGFEDYDAHVAKNGRFYMVEVNILIPKSFQISSVSELDDIRDRIEKALQIPSYKIWLSVSFTANTKWL
ncbi:cation diffusion facilitator family transporter [Helicobacter fennelliae]|uniref:Cation diffusion facilitator family transporter n=1 Tax=Helicobacter fennelliae TaxID=215 RepID=A0A2X3DD46_9HELI|nr:cation transporter [Helicobacter fennelliae]SQB97429.1 cation diffusion facilitator family transporter [Helicobacter fennelliae]